MFKWIRNIRKSLRRERDARRGIYVFETSNGIEIRVDPVTTYVRLKEIGFDVMSEDLDGVMRGNPEKTRAFLKVVYDAFKVEEFDPRKDKGVTALDAIRLYLGFYSFIAALKKNLPLLQGFAPHLEERLRQLYSGRLGGSESTPTGSVSDSTQTSSQEAQQPDSQAGSEQAPPSTD